MATRQPAQETGRHQVLIIGSGFGGLFGAKALRRADVEVTMVAKTTHHLFQPLLYQVATGILSEGEIAPPTREVLSGQHNARVLLGEVTKIDLEQRLVTSHVLHRETVTPYDSLIVAAGAGQSYFGNDHFAEFAPGMKSIDDALELRGRIFGAFEMAEHACDPPSGAARSRSSWSVRGPREWSWPGSSRSSHAARCTGTFGISIPRTRGCSCWTRGRPSSPRSPRRCGSARRATCRRSASRST
jgi:Pyridine nucleotide-disulphide oxidoreductase